MDELLTYNPEVRSIRLDRLFTNLDLTRNTTC